jgi:tetratricopeptide (TPR) repeat protein
MKIFQKKRNRWLGLGSLIGALMLLCALHLLTWKNVQVEDFNAGLTAYQAGDMQKAVQLFDKSVAAYKGALASENSVRDYIYPAPNRSVAARAQFQKAKALLQLKQGPAALDAFKESLLLNPGNGYNDMLLSVAKRMEAEARYTQYDLELLFKNNPAMAQQEGKGKGKGKGQPGNSQVPGTEPGNMPGKGDRNNI